MGITLIQTFNAFFLAAIVLAGPVLITAGLWATAGNLRRLISGAPELRPARGTLRQP
ncbi:MULTISPECIES: hypothetical protein [Nesterenkonia]|uniref:Uncharacterized protein n=2 Tax=Nesterenkonia TaxID=57494 RepID=A0A839FUG1_9MICC|nr:MULTISPECIES: hypothetical protein [Nesterenkonia]MBA8922211.1 hypothetical protein [Nesterenkonia jeotgali]NYJ16252.1 hypothetical protein [Nesterenkonia sandarakina]